MLSLSEICRIIGLSPSSGFNLLKTLADERMIERDPRTKRYQLAAAWRNVRALAENEATRLEERARPIIARFAQGTETAVGLWKVVSTDRMQLAIHAECDAAMRLRLADDQRQPLGAGAAGRAIAAAQAVGGAEIRRRFGAVRWQAELPFETYARQIAEASARGFAIDHGYAHRGVCTVAVGIADIKPGFCLSASLVAGSRTEEEIEVLGLDLVDASKACLTASTLGN